jgi:hypothetical protein
MLTRLAGSRASRGRVMNALYAVKKTVLTAMPSASARIETPVSQTSVRWRANHPRYVTAGSRGDPAVALEIRKRKAATPARRKCRQWTRRN